jgi:SAM-dependent methyltransferase
MTHQTDIDAVARQAESAKAGFTQIYASGSQPWDIGKPQPPFVTVAGQIEGPLLDAGCGKGATALYFAARGLAVTGIDFVESAIDEARVAASTRGISARFLVKDAMTLADWGERFASVIDSGLFHVYAGDAERTRAYVEGLAHVLEPGGRLYLFSFSDDPGAPGGGVSKADLEAAFANGWEIESLETTTGELPPAFASEPWADVKMWFAIIRREGSR